MKEIKLFLNIKKYFKNYSFLYKFYFLYYFKSLIAPIIPFVFSPLYTICFLYLYGPGFSSVILPSLITNPLIFIAFWTGSSIIMDIKKNSLVEKYFIFSKNSFSVNLVSFLFLMLIMFLSFFLNLLVIFLVSFDVNFFQVNILENISWGYLFFSFIFSSILSASICILLSSLFNSMIFLQVVNYVLSFFLLIMSGGIVPISSLVSNKVTNGISYLSIFRYINGLFIESLNSNNLTNTNIFNLNTPYQIINPNLINNQDLGIILDLSNKITIFHDYDQSLNLFISVFGSLGLFAFAMMLNRSKKRK